MQVMNNVTSTIPEHKRYESLSVEMMYNHDVKSSHTVPCLEKPQPFLIHLPNNWQQDMDSLLKLIKIESERILF